MEAESDIYLFAGPVIVGDNVGGDRYTGDVRRPALIERLSAARCGVESVHEIDGRCLACYADIHRFFGRAQRDDCVAVVLHGADHLHGDEPKLALARR